jgi:hypothetical protein
MAGTLQARWYLELGQHGRAGAAFAAFPLPDDALPFVRAYRGLVHAQVAAAAHDIGTAQHLLQDAIQAARASDAARRWLHDTAQRLVPPEFRESFLHRQPVNVALQSTRQGGAQEEPRRA